MSKTMTARDITSALAQLDADHGHVITNALNVYADYMRKNAAEAQRAHDALAAGKTLVQPAPELTAGQIGELREAAGELDSALVSGSYEDVTEAAAALLTLVRTVVVPEPPEPGGHSFTVVPTQSGWSGMAQMFGESADKADRARDAFEDLAGQADETASTIAY